MITTYQISYRIIPIMILLKLMEIGFIAKREKNIFTKEDIEVKNNAPEFPYVGMSEADI